MTLHGVRLSDPLRLAGGLRVRHLMQMTGGIPHGRWQVPVDGRDPSFDIARLLDGHGGPVSRPGERFLHSNLSFGALEVVIAPVRSMPLHLGALRRDSGLRAEAIARLHDATQPGEPSHLRYMGGWGHLRGGLPLSLLSDGQIAGSNTALLLVPERAIGVACLVNRSGGDAVEATTDIVNALLPGYRDAFFRCVGRLEAVESGDGVNALPELEGTWAGRARLTPDRCGPRSGARRGIASTGRLLPGTGAP